MCECKKKFFNFASVMSKIRCIVFVAFLFGGVVSASARDVYDLGTGWTFFFGTQVHTDNAPTVNLPHTWNATFAETFFRGDGNYLKTIDVPASWTGRRVFLRIGGAATVADVFANSRHAATHAGGSSAFTVELTDYLRVGAKNMLRIVVNNSPRLDVMPTAGEENVYGGLFRGAELIVCEPLSVSPTVDGTDGIRVETATITREKAEGVVRLRLLGAGSAISAGAGVGAGFVTGAAVATGAATGAAAAITTAARANAATVGTTVAAGSATGAGTGAMTGAVTGAAAGAVTGATVTTGTATGAVAGAATATGTGTSLASVRILDAGGEVVANESAVISHDTNELSIPFSIPDPHLWHGVADPHLYNVEVKLTRPDGSTADSLMVRTGFRTVAVSDDNKLLLNGVPVRVRGVIVHRDWAMVGTALGGFQIEEDVALIREMGANAVRVAGGQHDPYFYDLCDAAGLMVWSDLPFTGAAYPTDIDFVDTQAFRSNGKEQLTEMIGQLAHHPSVVVWGLFSNVSTTAGDDPVPYIRELNELAHSLDNQRLTGGSSVQNGDINTITDLVSFDLPFGWESGPPDGVAPWLTELSRNWGHLRAGISYGAPGSIFERSERLQKPDIDSGRHPENWQTFVHKEYLRLAVDAPQLWGVFVGNMFDFGSAKAPRNGLTGGSGGGFSIDERGRVTFDRKYRKAAFRLYKSAWADQP